VQVLKDRVYKNKYKHERQEVTLMRDSYNEAIKSAKGIAEGTFDAADDALKTIKENSPFK
jgi:hypothetical protein